MPRPRSIPDETILQAAFGVIQRIGPHEMTLQDVSTATGLSPATLLQRFGSKRGLLLALVKLGAAGTAEECVDLYLQQHASPFDALLAAAMQVASHVSTHQELANSLAFLHLEISDSEMLPWAQQHAAMMVQVFEKLIDRSIKAGELIRCNHRKLASALSAVAGGSLVNWAIHRQGTVKAWVRKDVMQLLTPYRVSVREI